LPPLYEGFDRPFSPFPVPFSAIKAIPTPVRKIFD